MPAGAAASAHNVRRDLGGLRYVVAHCSPFLQILQQSSIMRLFHNTVTCFGRMRRSPKAAARAAATNSSGIRTEQRRRHRAAKRSGFSASSCSHPSSSICRHTRTQGFTDSGNTSRGASHRGLPDLSLLRVAVLEHFWGNSIC